MTLSLKMLIGGVHLPVSLKREADNSNVALLPKFLNLGIIMSSLYDSYSAQVLGKKPEKSRGNRVLYRRQGSIQAPTQNINSNLLPFDSKDAVKLLNQAIGTLASAKIEEELAKTEYKETKKAVLEAFAEKVEATKEELAAIVKVAEAKAKDKVLNLDDAASAVLKVLDFDSNDGDIDEVSLRT